MRRYMIDLETLGLKHDAVILSIGAVRFDSDGPIPGEELYIELDTESQPEHRVDIDTLKWWMHQTSIGNPMPVHGKVKPHHACFQLFDFLGIVEKEDEIWANGINFDMPKLEHLITTQGCYLPWKYHQVRDLRTLSKLFPGIPCGVNEQKHNALCDARVQAQLAADILYSITESPIIGRIQS